MTDPREGACWPHDELSVHSSDTGLSDNWLHSIGNLFTDNVVLYYMKGL